jgi:quercetin 2,3-dioxygenase
MTAGSGIIHQEMPKGTAEGAMHGFQLWANLPASHKMMDPRYQEVLSASIPETRLDSGVKIRIVCGTYGKIRGPVENIVVDPEFLDITVPSGAEYRHPTKKGYTAVAYVIDGMGTFCGARDPFGYDAQGENYFDTARKPQATDGTLILFGDGEEITVQTDGKPVRFLFLSGKPLKEPVAWYGPIVMNTREELEIAFREYEEGTFIKGKR